MLTVQRKFSYSVEIHLSVRWFSGSPIIRICLALRAHLVERFKKNKLTLKLPVIRSSTLQCYGFWNFKLGVVERFRCRCIL